jgi:hypothetical protein
LISRRSFLRGAAAGAILAPLGAGIASSQAPSRGVLYNGIALGSPWPPRLKYPNDHPVTPAYLIEPPAVIPIDVGRQLFVDDFLIDRTSLARTYHHAEYHSANPVLRPEKPWELSDPVAERTERRPNPAAMVFSDGVFFDPEDRLFKMWYMGGYGATTCLATSQDGVSWTRPVLDVVAGTNIVVNGNRDSSTVWLDHTATDRSSRFKMSVWYEHALTLSESADGVHWREVGRTGPTGDRSTFFYNPFRNVWVFSLRSDFNAQGSISGRYRKYWEAAKFRDAIGWSGVDPVAWVKADTADFARPGAQSPAELYTLDAAGYESVLIGLFSVWRGESEIREKINEVTIGFSRDGFHWHRPDRTAFAPVSEREGSWNWSNVQSAGGGCVIVGDRLHFYVSGRQGVPGTALPGICSTGLATLRRDGFASMDWLPEDTRVRRRVDDPSGAGVLITRPIRFSGGHLFVNADLDGGELRIEVLDQSGRTISAFSREACVPITGNATRMAVTWRQAALASIAGQTVRLRFVMTRGRLYSFWVSKWPTGESGGYVAGGGPGFAGLADARTR